MSYRNRSNTRGALAISNRYLKTADAYGPSTEPAQEARQLAIQWAIVQGINETLDSQAYTQTGHEAGSEAGFNGRIAYANTSANVLLDALHDAGFKIIRAPRK